MKKTAVYGICAVIFLGLFLSVPFASAQTSSSADLQALIKQLQEQIKTLQARVKTLEQELGESAESTPSASATETPVSSATFQLPVLNIPETAVEIPELTQNLGIGSRGEDVKKLQKYLAQDKEIYPEGLVTGFFGSLTEKAAKKWQEKNEIEATGTIGPKSRVSLHEAISATNIVAITTPAGEKVTICHFPPGNPDNSQVIEIDKSALSAHLVHGDTIGACVSTLPKPTPTPSPPAAAVPAALLPPPATQEGNNMGTARFSYFVGGDKYSQLVTFYYDASALPRVRSFRFYYQKPTDPFFNVVATFNNPESLPSRCTSGAKVGTLISGEWKLDYTCGWKTAKHGVNPYWRIRLNNEYPSSHFTPGEYKFYLTAVDASGLESAPSSIFKQHVLEPLRIISPTMNQSPVASPPVIKWTIARGWPSTLSSLLYDILIGDGKYGVYSKPLWNVDLSLCEASFVYDGPPLDPSKTYTIGISSQHYVYHVTPTQVSHPTVDYISMLEKREKFKISGAVSTTTAIASAVSTPCPSSVSAAAPIISARPATTTSARVPPPAATTTPLATSTALAIPAIPDQPIDQTSTTTIPAISAIPAQSAVPASVVPQPLPSSSVALSPAPTPAVPPDPAPTPTATTTPPPSLTLPPPPPPPPAPPPASSTSTSSTAPTVLLSSNLMTVTAGQSFILTIEGTSEVGLASVWWYGTNTGVTDASVVFSYPASPTSTTQFTTSVSNPTKLDRAFGSPYFSTAQAVKNYSFSSSVTIHAAGVYKFGANSRDILYPVPGEAHQASEGAGVSYITITVTDALVCKDTDGGKDYFVKGSVYSSDISHPYYTDYCDGSILHEFSCSPFTTSITGITQSFYTCPNGCLNGVCIQSSTTTSVISSDLNLTMILKSLSSVLQKLQKALR